MKKIFLINPFADFKSKSGGMKSWNGYSAPAILHDFLELKNIESKVINLNELFLDTFFSEPFIVEFYEGIKKHILDLEKKEKLKSAEIKDYLSMKLLVAIVENNKNKDVLQSINGAYNNLPVLGFQVLKDINILQGGEIKVFVDDEELLGKINNFNRVMKKILKDMDFNNSLIVFSVPGKNQFNSIIQTGKLIKELFPTSKIVIGGSYVNLVSESKLDELVKYNIIDMYVTDGDEGKLLSLAREFQSETVLDFRGKYEKSEKISINDLRRIRPTGEKGQVLLLSKGCYWGKCAFCDYPSVCKEFAVKKIDVIMDEIENLYAQGVTNFRLMTDCLIPSIGVSIAKEILKRNLKIKWDSMFIRIDPRFTKEAFLLLKESGFIFSRVSVGMESSIDAVLKKVNKGYTKKIIEEFINNAKSAGVVFAKFNIIYNLPGTTTENIKEMKEFIFNIYDVSKSVTGGELYVSKTSCLGINPEKYGITLMGDDTEVTSKDASLFVLDNDLSMEEKINIERFFYLQGALYFTSLNYPDLKMDRLARTEIYTEKDFRLFVKTGEDFVIVKSLFNEKGELDVMNLTIPLDAKEFTLGEIFLFKEMHRLERSKWYSLGELAEIIGYSSSLEKIRLFQKLFYGAVAILATKGFAGAKIEEVK